MIPEYDNEKPIRFQWEIDNIQNTNALPEVDPNGYVIRKSHSNYVGTRIKFPNNKFGYTHFTMLVPPKSYISKSNIHEHGVFAATDFSPGDLIEESKMILLDTTEKHSKDWMLNRYAIALPCDCDVCKVNGKTLFVATGNIMLYNHSDTPNAFYYIERPFRRIKVIALTNIKKGDEITWYYGSDVEAKFKDIIKYYPRPDVVDGIPGYFPSEVTTKPCQSCQEKSANKSADEIQFRSMIVPERIVE